MKSPKKFKLLRFGKSYLSRDGELAVVLKSGDRKKGYKLAVSSARYFLNGDLQVLSRVIPNDGEWWELEFASFRDVAFMHANGFKVLAAPR
jgi:hypothetical protein